MNRESYILASQINYYYYYFLWASGPAAPPRCWPCGPRVMRGGLMRVSGLKTSAHPAFFPVGRGPTRMARPTLPPHPKA